MRTVVFTDPHIIEPAVDEINDIFMEIQRESDRNTVLVCVGDWFDKKRPTPREINFSAKWGKRFSVYYKKFVIVKGNHPTISNELSAIDYLEYMDVIIRERLEVGDIYFGHHFHEKSLGYFGNEKLPDVDYSRYKYAFLGHDHTFQDLGNGIYHPGSIRYCNFGEANIPDKKFALIEDDKLEWIVLNNVIPMKVISDKNLSDLDSIDPKTKVRVDFNDLETFKATVNGLNKYKKKFYQFKIKLDFKATNTKVVTTNNFAESLKNWLNNIADTDVKGLLDDAFKEHYTS